MSYLSVGTVPVQSDGLNSAPSPKVYGDIEPSIKVNTHTHKYTQKGAFLAKNLPLVSQYPHIVIYSEYRFFYHF